MNSSRADRRNDILAHPEVRHVRGVPVRSPGPARRSQFPRLALQPRLRRGGRYIHEQSVMEGEDNAPGEVILERSDDRSLRGNSVVYGSGDLHCSP